MESFLWYQPFVENNFERSKANFVLENRFSAGRNKTAEVMNMH